MKVNQVTWPVKTIRLRRGITKSGEPRVVRMTQDVTRHEMEHPPGAPLASAEHLAKLRFEGVSARNKWRRSHPDVVPELEGVVFRRQDLRSTDLSRANLRMPDIRRRPFALVKTYWQLRSQLAFREHRLRVSKQFRDISDKLNLDWDCVIHSCRHTFCTRLGERGADALTIQKLAGHSSITISQRYLHPTPARLESAVGLLEDADDTDYE